MTVTNPRFTGIFATTTRYDQATETVNNADTSNKDR